MFNLEQTRKKAQFQIDLNDKALFKRLREKYSDTSNRANVYKLKALDKMIQEGITVNVDRTTEIKSILLNLVKDKNKNKNNFS